jgi:hypothetical protein
MQLMRLKIQPMIQSAISKNIRSNVIVCDVVIREELRTVKVSKTFSWDSTHFESDRRVWVKISESTFYYDNKARLTNLSLWKPTEYYLVNSYTVRKKYLEPIDWEDDTFAELWKHNSIYESTLQPNYDDLIKLSIISKNLND